MTIPRRYDALLAEETIIPMHHHEESKNALLARTPDGFREVSPTEADAIAAECSLIREHDEVEIDDDGPVRLQDRLFRRRRVLQGAGVGLGSMLAASSLPRLSFAAGPGGRDTLVVIFLRGGMDGLSAVVPVSDDSYYRARPTIAVKASDTLRLNDSFGLNASLKALKPLWDAGDLACVLGTGNPKVTRSHFDDMDSMELAQGTAPAQVRSGWIARHLASVSTSKGTFRALTMGSSVSTSLVTNAFESLAMTNIADFDIPAWSEYRSEVLKTLDAMYGTVGGELNAAADATLAAVAGLADLRAQKYTPSGGAVYPDTPFGRGLRDIARIIKAGKGLEAACVDLGGWDHHKGLMSTDPNVPGFNLLATQLAAGLAAFRLDLGSHWNSTSVVTMSEFGRRVAENGDRGTDHGHGGVMFFAGGAVKGGVYGSQPTLSSSNLTQGDVPIRHDYRMGLAELVSDRLKNGANLATVFPSYTPTYHDLF